MKLQTPTFAHKFGAPSNNTGIVIGIAAIGLIALAFYFSNSKSPNGSVPVAALPFSPIQPSNNVTK